jgi:uncharacterized protein (DUF1501 family)
MLKLSAALCCGAAAGALGVPAAALAAIPGDRRLVVIILRGGMDGLGAVVPYGDKSLADYRNSILLGKPGTNNGGLDLDGFFALNPAMSEFHAMYQRKQAVVFHAVASPYRERSHFDAQNVLELGTTQVGGAHSGWLNRLLSLYGTQARRMGLAAGSAVPLMLSGEVPVVSWSPGGGAGRSEDLLTRVEALYQDDPLFHGALAEAKQAQAVADEALGNYQRQGGGFPGLANSVGRLLRAPEGARIAVMELDGWDTHNGQGAYNGRLAGALRDLSGGIQSLATGLGPDWDKTAVIAMTEFGRTVAENGTQGTDHGTGTAAFLAGGAVDGGKVIADWPGLEAGKLYQSRDLAPTTDTRAILKGVLKDLLQVPEQDLADAVFPRSVVIRPMTGLIKRSI